MTGAVEVGGAREDGPPSPDQLQCSNVVPRKSAFPPSTALAPHSATPALTGHRNIVGEDHGEMWFAEKAAAFEHLADAGS